MIRMFSIDIIIVNRVLIDFFYKSVEPDPNTLSVVLRSINVKEIIREFFFNPTIVGFGAQNLLIGGSINLGNKEIKNNSYDSMKLEDSQKDEFIQGYNSTIIRYNLEEGIWPKIIREVKAQEVDTAFFNGESKKNDTLIESRMFSTGKNILLDDPIWANVVNAFKVLQVNDYTTASCLMFKSLEATVKEWLERNGTYAKKNIAYILNVLLKEKIKTDKPVLDDEIMGNINILRMIKNCDSHNTLNDKLLFKFVREKVMELSELEEPDVNQEMAAKVVKANNYINVAEQRIILNCIADCFLALKYFELDIPNSEFDTEYFRTNDIEVFEFFIKFRAQILNGLRYLELNNKL